MITVLHVITSIEPGGAEHHLLSLAKSQVKSGNKVLLAFMKNTVRNLTSEFEEAGVILYPMELSYYGEIKPILSLRTLIRSEAPDVVHAHLPPAELYTRIAMLGVRKNAFIISKHNDERFAPVPLAVYMARWVAREADCVICISRAVKKFWSQNRVIKSGRSLVIHYGIAPITQPKRDIFRNSLGIEKDEVVFGFVGRLVPQKSLDNLFRAFALLKNSSARLVIVGDGELKGELQVIAEKLYISDKVIFTGFRDDIPTVMAGLDVFVLSSIYEGFGLVLLEAMRAAKPVLATRVSAIPEVVSDEVTGILVPACNPEIMAEAMKRFMNEENRVRMGQAGKVRVAEEFGVERMSQRTCQVYERTLNPCVE